MKCDLIDFDELANYLKIQITFNYELQEMNKDTLINLILGELRTCIESLHTQDKAKSSLLIIFNLIYDYQLYRETKFTSKYREKVQRKNKSYERLIISKAEELQEILYQGYNVNTPQYELIKLLNDVKKEPFKYAKLPDEVPEDFSITRMKSNIIMALSEKFNNKKCKNRLDKLFKKFDELLPKYQ